MFTCGCIVDIQKLFGWLNGSLILLMQGLMDYFIKPSKSSNIIIALFWNHLTPSSTSDMYSPIKKKKTMWTKTMLQVSCHVLHCLLCMEWYRCCRLWLDNGASSQTHDADGNQIEGEK